MAVHRRKLGRTSDHRKALLRNLATSVLQHGRIETTFQKAKEAQRAVDRMVTLGKKGTLAARRRALSYLFNEDVVTKLFGEIAEKYGDRNGGYTRVLKMGPRRGDGAEMAICELV